jgi:predicted adenylyl cyclase CyaB
MILHGLKVKEVQDTDTRDPGRTLSQRHALRGAIIGQVHMARNIEIKARVPDLAAVRAKVAALASGPGDTIVQIDTFFVVAKGRLKIREFPDGSGELIAYERPDHTGPKESQYTRLSCDTPEVLAQALGRVLPLRGRVVKHREVFIVGRTRVHLDDVENLGSFVELEVVVRDDESAGDAEREAHELMAALAIPSAALVSGAYIDLLENLAIVRP